MEKDFALDGWDGIFAFIVVPRHHSELMTIGGYGITNADVSPDAFSEAIQTLSLSGLAPPGVRNIWRGGYSHS
jgi:hypothetical protein